LHAKRSVAHRRGEGQEPRMSPPVSQASLILQSVHKINRDEPSLGTGRICMFEYLVLEILQILRFF
jgi:hypothetical protein